MVSIPSISPRMFYLAGIATFILVGLTNLWTTLANWEVLTLASKVGQLAWIFFNCIIVLFFYTNLKNSPKVSYEDSTKDIDGLLDEINKENKNASD